MDTDYVYEHIVTFAETNLVGNVYFVHYAAWQGICREQFLMDYAPGIVNQLTEGSLALVTVRLEIDFFDECFAGDRVRILMRQLGPGAHGTSSRVQMGFTYMRSGVMVATGVQTVACMTKNDNGYHICEVPPELRRALAQFGGVNHAS